MNLKVVKQTSTIKHPENAQRQGACRIADGTVFALA